MEAKRIIYYYQTFTGLSKLLAISPQPTTHIHLASIHFGLEKDGITPYIHLNDKHPDDPAFDDVWDDCIKAKLQGIEIILMIGGSGGGYSTLFSNFNKYYEMLQTTLKNHPEISGIDLDIEEPTSLENVDMLISQIIKDYPHFIISLAPVSSSLENDGSPMTGFNYKKLYNKFQNEISYFNGQFYYGDYSLEGFEKCIENGYPENKIVMGMVSQPHTLENNLKVLKEIARKYPNMGGAFVWELYDADTNPEIWSVKVERAIYPEDSMILPYAMFCNIL